MPDAPLIVGVSGLRGIVGESLTPEVAVRYAAAFGTWLAERVDMPRVLVCRDGRAGGGMFLDAAIAGLRATGCDAVDCDVLTTPGAGVIAVERGCDAAIVVTASHNPQRWNGLKFLLIEDEAAAAPDAASAAEIIARFRSGEPAWASDPDTIGVRERDDPSVCVLHAGAVAEAIDRVVGWDRGAPIAATGRLVLDSVNCSGAASAAKLLGILCVASVQLAGDEFGIFPHTPEPTAENLSGEGGLCDAVPGLKADVGFAQDPDADRLAIVDEIGRYIGEEYTLVLCAESLLSAWKSRDDDDDRQPVMVVNLSTSRMIEDVAAKYGARVERTAVGEANVVERMKALKASGEFVILGGEGNGGVIWPEVTYVRDSLSGMALVLSLMARSEKTVSELVAQIDACSPGGQGYAIVKTKAEIPSKNAAKPAVDAVAKTYADQRVDLQDGVRVDFDPAGPRAGTWVHVRASNTEPIMRLICEAPTAELAREVLAEVNGVIAG